MPMIPTGIHTIRQDGASAGAGVLAAVLAVMVAMVVFTPAGITPIITAAGTIRFTRTMVAGVTHIGADIMAEDTMAEVTGAMDTRIVATGTTEGKTTPEAATRML